MAGKKVLPDLEKAFQVLSDKKQAAILQRFFKTGPGEYGEGDRFLGIKVPVIRSLIKEYHHLSLTEIRRLLRSVYHEVRLAAVLLLVQQYQKGDAARKEKIFRLYLDSTIYINNWDLVDLSAPQIIGAHLFERDRKRLNQLIRSESLWERRIALLATLYFIRNNEFTDTFHLAEAAMHDKEELIHKAAGWMLREVGKRDETALKTFLRTRYQTMPRTMLRYSIEKFDKKERQKYLKGLIESR